MNKLKILWLASFPFEKTKKNQAKSNSLIHPAPWITNLANHLSNQEDVDFSLISFSSSIKKDLSFSESKVNFYFLRRFSVFKKPFPLYYKEKKKVLKIINQIKPDIIHCHGTEDLYSYIALQTKYPIVISIQGIMYEIFQVMEKGINIKTLRRYVIRYVESKVLYKSRNIIAKTDFVRNFLKASGYDDKQIYDIPNIIDNRFFNAVRKAPYKYDLTFVGSILPEKGIFDLINCLVLVKKKIPTINLNIIGYKNSKFVEVILKKYIKERSLENNILFSGFKSHNEIVPLLEKTKLLVLPSHMDTSPNVISEAMAAGVPVIATKVGGIPFMIENAVSGTLVKPFSPNGLAEKILYLLKNENVREHMAIRAKELIFKNQNADAVTEKTLDCYYDIISKTKKPT